MHTYIHTYIHTHVHTCVTHRHTHIHMTDIDQGIWHLPVGLLQLLPNINSVVQRSILCCHFGSSRVTFGRAPGSTCPRHITNFIYSPVRNLSVGITRHGLGFPQGSLACPNVSLLYSGMMLFLMIYHHTSDIMSSLTIRCSSP